ncbi:MAG: tetratricopeptide repeat protein [Nitrospirae bacterium]|nr:tetratricopeptide repeat protein [Nitrospirota bacterium]
MPAKYSMKILLILFVSLVFVSLSFAEGGEEAQKYYEAKKYYDEGILLYNKGQIEDAIQYMRKAINLYPDAAGVYMDIGAMYFLLNKFEETIKHETIALHLYKKLSNKDGEALAQFWLGRSYAVTGQHEKAVDFFKESIKLKPDFADANYWLGYTYIDLKQFQESIEHYKQSIRLDPNNIFAFNDLGFAYQNLGDYENAIPYYKEAIKKKPDSYVAYFNLGDTYRELGQYENAISFYKEAIRLKPDFIAAHTNLGVVYYKLGQYEQAIDSYKQRLRIKSDGFLTYLNLGDTYRSLGQYDNAIDSYRESIKLRPDSPDAHYMLGVCYMLISDFKKAIEFFNETIKINPDYADAHQDIGGVYYAIGKIDSAIEHQKIALKLYQKFSNKNAEAASLFLLGKINMTKGEDIFALNNLQNALSIYRELKNLKGEAEALNAIGNQYALLGDDSTALEYHKKALTVSEKIGDEELLVRTLGFMTVASFEALDSPENYNEAIKYGKRAIEIGRKNSLSIYNAYRGLGYAYWSNGDYKNALSLGRKFMEILEELKHQEGSNSIIKYYEASTYSIVGGAYATLENYQQALEYMQKAIVLFDELGDFDKGAKWVSFWRRGIINDKLGNIAKAKDDYLRAINILETLRDNKQSLESKMAMSVNASEVYGNTILLLLKTNEPDEAFNYMERAKARTFLDLVGSKSVLQDKGVFEEERRLQFRINYLSEKIRETNERPDKKASPQTELSLEKQLNDTRSEYASLIEKIKKDNPELSTFLTVNPLNLKQVQELLDADTTLLEYFITPDKTLLWIVDKSALNVVEIDVKDKDLKAKVNAFREKIANLKPEYSKDADELYNLLVKPAKPYIKTKRIGIVPHSVLHYLPFHALLNNNKFLIEEYEMFYTPSASVLKFVYEKRKELKGKVLAFGNPSLGDDTLNLPFAEDEVKMIKAAYPDTSLYLKEKATEDKAKTLSSGYDIIHFASHGELNPAAPMFSSIRLAKDKDEDGRLEVNEIFNLNLRNTSLVTLSACETGLGKLTNGDELTGLSRAFIYAGTPSIVASLWRVNDQSTSELMRIFYRNLKSHPKSESLRMAQLEMIRGKTGKGIVRGVGGITPSKENKPESREESRSSLTVDGSHPYFWAPFILIGDWK